MRLPDVEAGHFPEGFDWDASLAYWRQSTTWMLYLGGGVLGNLHAHEVQEHEDGTITVSPSILVTGSGHRHGFLRRGVWEPCSDDVAP